MTTSAYNPRYTLSRVLDLLEKHPDRYYTSSGQSTTSQDGQRADCTFQIAVWYKERIAPLEKPWQMRMVSYDRSGFTRFDRWSQFAYRHELVEYLSAPTVAWDVRVTDETLLRLDWQEAEAWTPNR